MINSRLKQRRIELGLSQSQLGEYLHLNRQSISQYENNNRQVPLELLKELSFPLEFDLIITEGELIFMENLQLGLTEEMEVVKNWRKDLCDYLKNEPHLTLKKLDEQQKSLAEKYQLSFWKEDIVLMMVEDFFMMPLEDDNINWYINRKTDVILEDTLILAESIEPNRGDEYYEEVNLRPKRIIDEQLKSAECINFSFIFDKDYGAIIENFFERLIAKETEGSELKTIIENIPIEVHSLSSVFFATEGQTMNN